MISDCRRHHHISSMWMSSMVNEWVSRQVKWIKLNICSKRKIERGSEKKQLKAQRGRPEDRDEEQVEIIQHSFFITSDSLALAFILLFHMHNRADAATRQPATTSQQISFEEKKNDQKRWKCNFDSSLHTCQTQRDIHIPAEQIHIRQLFRLLQQFITGRICLI